jgi:hypothetical protein
VTIHNTQSDNSRIHSPAEEFEVQSPHIFRGRSQVSSFVLWPELRYCLVEGLIIFRVTTVPVDPNARIPHDATGPGSANRVGKIEKVEKK